jgi:hypothetical protein
MKTSPIVLKDRMCATGDQQVCNTVFEALLADRSYSVEYQSNHYATGVRHMYDSCDLLDWHASVQPLTAVVDLSDESFLLACAYRKAGERE